DFQFTSVEKDSAAVSRSAAVHEHDSSILLLLERRAALRTAHPILCLFILRREVRSFRFRLLAELRDAFEILLIKVLVFFAVALLFKIVFHRDFNLTPH